MSDVSSRVCWKERKFPISRLPIPSIFYHLSSLRQKSGHLVRFSYQKEPWRVIQIAQEQSTYANTFPSNWEPLEDVWRLRLLKPILLFSFSRHFRCLSKMFAEFHGKRWVRSCTAYICHGFTSPHKIGDILLIFQPFGGWISWIS